MPKICIGWRGIDIDEAFRPSVVILFIYLFGNAIVVAFLDCLCHYSLCFYDIHRFLLCPAFLPSFVFVIHPETSLSFVSTILYRILEILFFVSKFVLDLVLFFSSLLFSSLFYFLSILYLLHQLIVGPWRLLLPPACSKAHTHLFHQSEILKQFSRDLLRDHPPPIG